MHGNVRLGNSDWEDGQEWRLEGMNGWDTRLYGRLRITAGSCTDMNTGIQDGEN